MDGKRGSQLGPREREPEATRQVWGGMLRGTKITADVGEEHLSTS